MARFSANSEEWQQAPVQRHEFALAHLWCQSVLTCALGMLAACTHYQAAPIAPEHSADEFAARRLTEIPLRDELMRLMPQTVTTWPPREWDRAELLAVALTQNPQLAVARAQVKAAQAHEITAAQPPNPDLTLQSEYARNDAHPWLYGIDLNWLLRSPERRRLNSEIAALDTSNARLQLMEQAWAVRSALAAALSDWESGRRRLSLLQRLAAAKALGLPPQALLSRADLGQAIGEYAAAESRLKLSIARQYPQFVLSPGYYWDHGIAKFPFDVGFELPFDGNRGEIAEARAGRELAGQRMLALQSIIYSEIMAAERAEHIARASTEAAERQLQSARNQKHSTDLGLRLGAADRQAQVAAEIITLRAELEVPQMRTLRQNSRNNLEDVLHTPLSGPEFALAKSMSSIVSGAGS